MVASAGDRDPGSPIRNDALCIAAASGAVLAWNAAFVGALDPAVGVFAAVLFALCRLAGAGWLAGTGCARSLGGDLPTSCLLGASLLASALLLCELALPFGPAGNAAAATLATAALAFAARGRLARQRGALRTSNASAGLWCLLLAAATFWSQDTLRAFDPRGPITVFAPPLDGFVHAAFVATFAVPDAPFAPSQLALAGEPLFFYHYGSYQLAALYAALTGSPAIVALCAFLVPLGALLVPLGAFALVRPAWGEAPGIAAALLLALLPASSWLGLDHPRFDYAWLQQVGPGGAYGSAVALAALALVSAGCRQGRAVPVVAGTALGLLCVLFKAQIAVALLPLLALWPMLFLRSVSWSRRRLLAGAWGLAFAAALWLEPRLSTSPGLALDPAWATGVYVRGEVLRDLPFAPLRDALLAALPSGSLAIDWLASLAILALASFGWLGAGYAGIAVWWLRRGRAEALDALPGLSILVYLLLATTLGPGQWSQPEELHHRSFVLPYALLVAWWGGRVGRAVCQRVPAGRRRLAGRLAFSLAFAGLLLPAQAGDGVTASRLSWAARFVHTALPTDWLRCTAFLREHSQPDEIVQDSRRDPWLITASLAERRAFLGRDGFLGRGRRESRLREVLARRAEALEGLEAAASSQSLARAAARTGIGWYLLHPGDRVAWPAAVLARPAFASGRYRVYRLPAS